MEKCQNRNVPETEKCLKRNELELPKPQKVTFSGLDQNGTLTLSDSDTFRFLHFLVLTLFYSDTF